MYQNKIVCFLFTILQQEQRDKCLYTAKGKLASNIKTWFEYSYYNKKTLKHLNERVWENLTVQEIPVLYSLGS